MTFDELLELRLKDTDLRVDDFLVYEYEFKVFEAEDVAEFFDDDKFVGNVYRLELPIKDYGGKKARVYYSVDENSIHLRMPVMEEHHSLLYEQGYYEHEFFHPDDNLVSFMYGTERPDAIDIYFFAYTETTEYTDDFSIYEGADKNGKLLSEISCTNSEKWTIPVGGYEIRKLSFANGGITEPGVYTIVYGDDLAEYTFELTEEDFYNN